LIKSKKHNNEIFDSVVDRY